MGTYRCGLGNVYAASDLPEVIESKHRGRLFKAVPGTVYITCECCQEEYMIPVPLAESAISSVLICRQGNVFGVAEPGEVQSRLLGRIFRAVPGTVVITCDCCKQRHPIAFTSTLLPIVANRV